MIDYGMGEGVKVTECRLSVESFNSSADLFTPKSPKLYDAVIPYVFPIHRQTVQTPTTGERLKISCFFGNLTIPCRLAYGKGFHPVAMNQWTERTWSNTIHTFSGGGALMYGELEIRGMTESDGKALKNFIDNVIKLNMYEFTLEAV